MLFGPIIKAAEQYGTPEFRNFRLLDHNQLSGNTKVRQMGAPNQAMRKLQRLFLKYLRTLSVDFTSAAGGRAGHSTRKALERHRHNRYFCTMDLSDAYGSVVLEAVAGNLSALDPRIDTDEAAAFLAKYFFAGEGGLVTGGPAAPELFNIYLAMSIDADLRAVASRYGLVFNRYLDDLVFSSHAGPIGKIKRRAIQAAIGRHGIAVNNRKTRVYDLAQGPITIYGLRLELGGRIWVPRKARDKLRGLQHRAATKGDVPSALLAGHAGAYKSATDPQTTSRSERRVLAAIGSSK